MEYKMEVPSGYEEYKRKKLLEARRRVQFEKETEWKVSTYII